MDAVKVLQVVGFKNSGKTALIEHLMGIAKENGKTVSTVKHHGHGGAPDMPSPTADSSRFFEHGAASSVVYGGGVIQLHQRKEEADLEELLEMASLAGPDVVFVEGFKEAPCDKIVLIRSEVDWEELKELKGIVLVVVPESLRMGGVGTVERNDLQQLKKWFLNWMEGEEDESI
ncbi:molybdopterin-guanine dinucleotide biosynthesis protein B [Planococcus shixiaomingii]|uniref:molybdopterin-guanine dinucleotide biosynthesis protein B n=1 Tax=Planococcus shixiaomingii TaxID=3058393 RepID=UPI0026297241|nr:molybdopterin-guanine dinucleotide biosynthesis protein B [Planococcus sp. N022]WKA54551.1 molybdopterin-guanine dinucleotide biosynthesis protein B [Planococcus sp. N022]